MADMVCSAVAQETVSRGVSYVLGKREEKASQSHLMERLAMAVSELEFALDKAKELPIRHVSLLDRRRMIKRAHVEAVELLDRHKQQAVPAGSEEIPRGVKRKRWIICARNMFLKPFVALSADDVRRFEWFAESAGRFVRDVESGCSLHHNTFCNPVVRRLLEGKTLRYVHLERGNVRRVFYIWPMYSDERGVEAILEYHYVSTMSEKLFHLRLYIRLSESTDIVGVTLKGLQLLTSEFKLAAECAMGELTMLPNLQDVSHWYGPPWVGIPQDFIKDTEIFRPDPACCKGSRHGLCPNNNVSSELANIFPEQVIRWSFECYYLPAIGPSRSSSSSFDVVGRRKSRGGGKPPLVLTAVFEPHAVMPEIQSSYALEFMGDNVPEHRDSSSIEQVAEALKKSDAINCFFREPELTQYIIYWYSRHGCGGFFARKASTERTGAPKTRRTYKTRGNSSG